MCSELSRVLGMKITGLLVCFLAYGQYVSTTPTYDTIVVGLGSAGTTAASTLAKAGRRVVALEAQDRIGGRVKTVPFGDGVVEEGGEWIQGTVNNRVYDTAVNNNISLLHQDIDLFIFRSDGGLGNTSIIKELLDYCLAEEKPEKPEILGSFITRKLKEYLKQKYPDLLKDEDFVSQLLEMVAQLINSYEAFDDWNNTTTYSGFVPLEGHQYVSWHTYGYRTFFQLLLNTYNNGPGIPTLDIKLNKEVTSITWPRDSVGKVQVLCKDGDVYTADNVIVTVSLGVLKERQANLFSPPLPREKVNVIDKMSIGVLTKIILNFEEEWLPNGSFFGFLWRGEELKKVSKEDLWTTKIYSFSRPMGLRTAITLWASGDVGRQVEIMPEEVVKTKVMELLRKFVGKTLNIPEPIGMIRSSWFNNPYTRGSYSYDNIFVAENPNARSILGEPLLDIAGNPKVLFAGEATVVTHYGTVNGASDSGYREAMRLLNKQD